MSSVARQISIRVDGVDIIVEQLEDGTFCKPAYLMGAERPVISITKNNIPRYRNTIDGIDGYTNDGRDADNWQQYTSRETYAITAPATPEATQYSGFGTGLKPAHETWWLCRKPLAEGSIAANVLKWGTGALNIDACRIATQDTLGRLNNPGANGWKNSSGGPTRATYDPIAASGRFPANLLLSHTLLCEESGCVEGCPVLELDRQSGMSKDRAHVRYNSAGKQGYGIDNRPFNTSGYADQGGASRYFQNFYYCSKPSRREKQAGCDELPSLVSSYRTNDPEESTLRTRLHKSIASKNNHPTVKPVSLLQYFIRLINPPGGIVLDLFAGSGTTALAAIQEGCDFILIEREQEYVAIAEARIKHALAEIA